MGNATETPWSASDSLAACPILASFIMWIVTFLWWYMVMILQLWAQMQIPIGTSELETVFGIEVRGRIGEGTDETEIRILNRIVRITPTGVRDEADPRHHELLVRSMGLEAGTSVVASGAKPALPETAVVKGEEMKCVGPVMDSTGRMREAFTDQDGNAQLKHNDALDDSLLVNRSLSADANDTSLDDRNDIA